jgi:hypothetical protein
MLGHRLLWAAAFVTCGAVGCLAQNEAAGPAAQETPSASTEVDSKPSPETGRRLAAQPQAADAPPRSLLKSRDPPAIPLTT